MCYFTKGGKLKDGILITSAVFALGSFTRMELNNKVESKGVTVDHNKKVNIIDRTLSNLVSSGNVTRRGRVYKTL